MKKSYLAGIAILLIIAMAGIVAANAEYGPTIVYECEPAEYPLIAGGGNVASAIEVGVIEVWNDEDTLYVKYVIDDMDWYITEWHLVVGVEDDPCTWPDGILTKKGNPIPGQFPYSGGSPDVHFAQEIGPIEVPFADIDGFDPEEDCLCIAAHAVVGSRCVN